MELKTTRNTKPKNELYEALKAFASGMSDIAKALGAQCARAFSALDKLICKNKAAAHFLHVILPAATNKIFSYIKRHRFKMAVLFICIIAALISLVCMTIKNTENSDYYPEGNDEIGFAMRFPHYSTFNHIEKTNIAVHLNWRDGAIDLNEGYAEARLIAEVYPIILENKEISWSSSDETIAVIDNEGKITAKKPGTVILTASLDAYGKKTTATLNVRQPVSGVFMPTSTLTLYLGGMGRLLSPVVLPEDASNKEIIWKSKNNKIARVDKNGRVKPVGIGITEIIAETADGAKTAKCFVNVVNSYVDVQTISVQNSEDMAIRVGDSINVVVTVTPNDARNKTLKWSTDNDKVAAVSQTGRVRGTGEGTANITVESVNGKKTSFAVTVAASDAPDPFKLNTDDEIMVGSVKYTPYSMTLPQAVNIQMLQNPPPKIWRYSGLVNAMEAETAEYMNPSAYYEGAYKYQFLDLSMPNNVSEEALNEYLADKGVLKGMGKVFIEAAQDYNVSEVYLIAHACLETGNGSSQLARGVEVNGATVYNVFGINAYDANPIGGGSSKAYKEGWTSVESAIRGGAEWINEYYIGAGQNTLYKMLWNPDNPGEHQYATDIGWAVKQAVSIEKIFSAFYDAVLSFDVPVYSGQIPPAISAD